MTFHAFLIKYAEIAIKGKNRYVFEQALVKQMELALDHVEGDFRVVREQGRVYVYCPDEYDYDEAVTALTRVFGIVYVCPVMIYEDNGLEQTCRDVTSYMEQVHPGYSGTFKVYTRRARKSYPVGSMDVSARAGEAILDAFPDARVDVHEPELTVSIEIRDRIYVYSRTIRGSTSRVMRLEFGSGRFCSPSPHPAERSFSLSPAHSTSDGCPRSLNTTAIASSRIVFANSSSCGGTEHPIMKSCHTITPFLSHQSKNASGS